MAEPFGMVIVIGLPLSFNTILEQEEGTILRDQLDGVVKLEDEADH